MDACLLERKVKAKQAADKRSGPVIDVTPNLVIWLTSLSRGTVLCIMQNLSKVLDTERTILAPSNQCAANSQLSSFDLFLYFGIPVYVMSIHYLWHLDYRLFRLHIDTRNLSKRFLDPERTVLIPSKPMHRKQLAFELFLCFGIPLYMTFIHHFRASGKTYRFLRSNIHFLSTPQLRSIQPQSHLEGKNGHNQVQTNPALSQKSRMSRPKQCWP